MTSSAIVISISFLTSALKPFTLQIADYLNDPLGSVVGLIDSTQTVTAKQAYWPYGEIQSQTGTWTSSRGFTGSSGQFTNPWGGISLICRVFHKKRQNSKARECDGGG